MSLYSKYFYSEIITEIFSAENAIIYMLEVEKALVYAQCKAEFFSSDIEKILTVLYSLEGIKIDDIKNGIDNSGNAAIPLIKILTKKVKAVSEEASKYVHLGATSQDIIDSAFTLQILDAHKEIDKYIVKVKAALRLLAQDYKNTIMVGRTLGQHAKPITFGLKAAFWYKSLCKNHDLLKHNLEGIRFSQLGGAVGSENKFIGAEIKTAFSEKLELKETEAFHTSRENLAHYLSALCVLHQSIGKICTDLGLLMQTEIAEVSEKMESGKGGSSAMPHKRNPVALPAILANAHKIPNLYGTFLGLMLQENERSVGLWHAEWELVSDILRVCGGTLEKSVDLLENLEVNSHKMLSNLELTNGLIYAETASLIFAEKLGKTEAFAIIENACNMAVSQNKHLREVLMDLNFDPKDLDLIFSPENNIGNAVKIVEDILNNYK